MRRHRCRKRGATRIKRPAVAPSISDRSGRDSRHDDGQRRTGTRGQAARRRRSHRPRLGAHPPRLQGRAVVRQRQRRLLLRADPGGRAELAAQLRGRGQAPHRRLRRDRHRHAGAVAGPGPELRDPGRTRSRWSAGSRIRRPIRSSPRRTRWNSCARSRTCARAPTCSARSPASATAWRRRCTASSTSTASTGSTRRSSPPPTPKAPGRCSASRRWTWPTCRATTTGSVDFRRDFFGKETFLTVSGQLNVEAYCLALTQGLHLRPDLPRREQQHDAPPRRVLDDRAGDRLRRPRRRTRSWPRTSSSTCSAPCCTSARTTWRSSPNACRRMRSAGWRRSSTRRSSASTTPTR